MSKGEMPLIAILVAILSFISCDGDNGTPLSVRDYSSIRGYAVDDPVDARRDVLYVAPLSAAEPEKVDDPETIDLILSSLSVHQRGKLDIEGYAVISDEDEIRVLSMFAVDTEVSHDVLWVIVRDRNVSWGCIKCCNVKDPCCKPCPACCAEDHSPKKS